MYSQSSYNRLYDKLTRLASGRYSKARQTEYDRLHAELRQRQTADAEEMHQKFLALLPISFEDAHKILDDTDALLAKYKRPN